MQADKEDDIEIDDGTERDETVPPESYQITSYGADYDVEGLVKRLDRNDILIPPFQRDYVWSLKDASRFIESLLLGLPVPGVFLAKESDTNKLLVIDGQQRLKTLQFFFSGFFNPKESDKRQRVFALVNVQDRFEGKTYKDLEEQDRIRLNDSILHATVIKQDSPEGDDTSVYYVFERLNSGGRKLTPQEIRSALYHGSLINLLEELNLHSQWREIFGPPHSRLKDVELILRFLALFNSTDKYQKPMKEFLGKFSKLHQNANQQTIETFRSLFISTIDFVQKSLGRKAFRPERGLNAAVFDSVMVALARRLSVRRPLSPEGLLKAYETLLSESTYLKLVSSSTSDVTNLQERFSIATKIFETAA